jgi:hypothetical protein
LLITNALESAVSVPTLVRFAQRHAHTTPQSRSRPQGVGPVLAYVPYAKSLELANRLARRSSLCIVESVGFPVGGWAAQVGAFDLIRKTATSPEPNAEVAEAMDNLRFYGNNGWGDEFGRRQARRVLSDLRARGLLEPDVVVSAMLARGCSDKAADRLAKLMGAKA